VTLDRFKRKRSLEKRSPLKASPLRNPGQSVDEEIQRIITDKIDEYLFWGAISVGFGMFEWCRWYFRLPPQPFLFTILAVCAGGFCLMRIRFYRKRIRNLRQGRDGEKAVGQYLDSLREKGYRVFHDVVGEGFNVDHVLIGKAGVFSIETKTISKPVRGQAEVEYDGETVALNGLVPERNPVVQAKAQSSWLQDLIKGSTGKAVVVRPVVLYPGWFVSKQPKGARVWVLNPKSLPAFLEHENGAMSPEDVGLVAFHLARYVRAGNRVAV
jgi:hypothetical protein